MIILSALTLIGQIGLMIGIPVAIGFLIVSFFEKDPITKQKRKKQALWSFLAPLLLLIGSIIVWGIISAIQYQPA